MDNNYIKALDIIEKAKYDLSKIYEKGTTETLEDKKAYKEIEKVLDCLDDAKDTIIHYNKPIWEGSLMENENGKFSIEFNDGSSPHALSCGSSLEVYLREDSDEDVDEGWHSGRVEANNKGYYFYGANKPMLYQGMRVRIRED